MTLPLPNLDDRDLDQLMVDAVARLRQVCPEWTDLSPGDPGMALLEVFAFLTETLLFRLNRIPERNYVALLNLIGVKRQPPAAASATLVFTRREATGSLVIPKGTEVTTRPGTGLGEPPVFITLSTLLLSPGETSASTLAIHAEEIDAELAGVSNGAPGLTVTASRAPILPSSPDGLELLVGVEARAEELDAQAVAVSHDGSSFRIWQVANSFANADASGYIVVVDRFSGTVRFAPALRLPGEDGVLGDTPTALAAVPPAGRQIRLWYRRGGGAAGNVRAHSLTVMRQPIEGVTVDNPQPASGGSDAESIANAMERGPLSLHSLDRAVTARDFELLAVRASPAINRASAYTQAALWAHGTPGTVEVLLVPQVPDELRARGRISLQDIVQEQSDAALEQVRFALEERRPLGTRCSVAWARLKTVRVAMTLRLHRQEDAAAVRSRVLSRINRLICPVSLEPGHRGWPFGQKLSSWDVLKAVGTEPGIAAVDRLGLILDDAPDASVTCIAHDAFQPAIWYCGSGPVLFRTTNATDSWEALGRFGPDAEVVIVRSASIQAGAGPSHAGLLFAVVREGNQYRIFCSRDAGETMVQIAQTQFEVLDAAWLHLDRSDAILLAGRAGLYLLSLENASTPTQILVDGANPTLGFVAVAVSRATDGQYTVAVAGADEAGVFISNDAAREGTFTHRGLDGELVGVLSVQHVGSQAFLWAGLAAPGREAGKGSFRLRLVSDDDDIENWAAFSAGWAAGSCLALHFDGTLVHAGSHRLGVLSLDPDAAQPAWEAPSVDCGLPLRDVGRLQPVNAVAASSGLVLAGGPAGVYRSTGSSLAFAACGRREVGTDLYLPANWVLCSGEHRIEVVGEA